MPHVLKTLLLLFIVWIAAARSLAAQTPGLENLDARYDSGSEPPLPFTPSADERPAQPIPRSNIASERSGRNPFAPVPIRATSHGEEANTPTAPDAEEPTPVESADRAALPALKVASPSRNRRDPDLQPTNPPHDSRPGALAEPSRTLALGPAKSRSNNPNDASQSTSATPSIATALGSLLIVVGLLLLVAWMFRKALPKSAATLPAEAVELLGRTALAPRQYVHLIRIGNKLLLVALSPGGAETLTEIDDPTEVDRLAGLCKQTHPTSSTNAFRHIFQQFAGERTTASFVDPGDNIKIANLGDRSENAHG